MDDDYVWLAVTYDRITLNSGNYKTTFNNA